MSVQRIFAVLVILLPGLWLCESAIAACDASHPDVDSMVGKWSWVYSYEFVGGSIDAPAPGSSPMVWEFTADGTFQTCADPSGSPMLYCSGTWCIRECEADQTNQGQCAGQFVLHLDFGHGEFDDGIREYDYRFCADQSSCFPFQDDYTDGLSVQMHALDAPIQIFERLQEVPAELNTWSVVKARFGQR